MIYTKQHKHMKSFQDLGLSDQWVDALSRRGITQPTEIQEQAIPFLLENKSDFIGLAQTGTGKTAAYGLPAMSLCPEDKGTTRYLIVSPTRELAMQIATELEKFSAGVKNLRVLAVYGGAPITGQLRDLRQQKPHILVATPGRLLDFCNRGEVHLDLVEVLILDEADRMLDMGFIPQVRQIIRQTPRKGDRQTLLFSATFSNDVMRLAQQWTLEPAVVEIEPERPASENITQKVYAVSSSDKYKLLYNLVTQLEMDRVMVFANRKDEVRRIQERLMRDGIDAAQLSGDVPQNKRVRTLDNFREGKLRVLVATDVAGRGIHIDGISHVINYTLPDDPEDYVHRIGRTGRAGAKGTSISFAGEDDAFQLPPIEELLGAGRAQRSEHARSHSAAIQPGEHPLPQRHQHRRRPSPPGGLRGIW